MRGLLAKPIVYLSVSFVLFMIAPLLVSLGTTVGSRSLLWIGLAALCVAGIIPPVQRLICGSQLPKMQEEQTS